MMGRLEQDQGQLFYLFCLEEVVPDDHQVRAIASVLELSWVYGELSPHYPALGRSSIDPVLMIRMLILGYAFGLRSERLLCREVRVNLAYRWFCGLSIEDKIRTIRCSRGPAMSGSMITTFFAGSLSVSLRHVFRRGWSVARSLRSMRAWSQRTPTSSGRSRARSGSSSAISETASRAVKEYMATLDDAAFGAATKVTPKFVSPSDPAAQWTGARRGPAFFAYSDNYLIDVKVGIIMDVEASRAIRQAEVGASKTMIERTQERFDIKPERLAGDTAYGSGANLNWLVKDMREGRQGCRKSRSRGSRGSTKKKTARQQR